MGTRDYTMEDFRRGLLYELPVTRRERREHAPLIALDLTRVVGCTCGWRTPLEATNSDTTHTIHATIARVTEGNEQ